MSTILPGLWGAAAFGLDGEGELYSKKMRLSDFFHTPGVSTYGATKG